MVLFDNHTHSCYSVDSITPLDEAVDFAKRRGLGGICFSEHYDFDVPEGTLSYKFDPIEQQKAIDEMILQSGFNILKGVEVGMQPHCIDEMEELVSSYNFDSVIGSLHFIDGTDPFHGNYYIPYNYKEAYGHYLEVIDRCISGFDNFDILGHFDYIARYAPYPECSITYSEFGDQLDSILKRLAQNGKTFEINTKTYLNVNGRQPVLDPMLLIRFRELGGEFISFGSDAHEKERIGENFELFVPLIKSCGIRYSVHYEKRRAVPTPL